VEERKQESSFFLIKVHTIMSMISDLQNSKDKALQIDARSFGKPGKLQWFYVVHGELFYLIEK
jgi:hypothetical protein